MPRAKRVPSPPREEIVQLREAGMTRDEIAKYYGVSVSRVKRWITEMDIKLSHEPKKTHAQARSREEKRHALGIDEGMTLIEKAKLILGHRVAEERGCYLLDGRPIRVDALCKAAGLMVISDDK